MKKKACGMYKYKLDEVFRSIRVDRGDSEQGVDTEKKGKERGEGGGGRRGRGT